MRGRTDRPPTGAGQARAVVATPGPDIRRVVSLALLTAALFFSLPSLASAGTTRLPLGQFGGAGGPTFSRLGGLAVDQNSGDVYAYDSAAESIFKFTSAGAVTDFSALGSNAIGGVGGAGAGENEIAVDSSSGETAGDIYVANNSSLLIYGPEGSPRGELTGEEPCGVAVDSAGDVYVGRYPETVQRYVPGAGQDAPTDSDLTATLTAPINLCNVGVQGDGSDVYAAHYNGGLYRYSASQFGEPQAAGTELDPAAYTLAVDPGSNHVFADEGDRVAEFDGAGNPVSTFGSGELSASSGVAVDAGGEVYVADGQTIQVFGPTVVTLPDAATEGATQIGETTAILNGTIGAAGGPEANCEFQYTTEANFEVGGFEGAKSIACSPPGPFSGSTTRGVEAEPGDLLAGTAYRFRVLANNENGSSPGAALGFETTTGPPLEGRGYELVSTGSKNDNDAMAVPVATLLHLDFQNFALVGSSGNSLEWDDRVPVPIRCRRTAYETITSRRADRPSGGRRLRSWHLPALAGTNSSSFGPPPPTFKRWS